MPALPMPVSRPAARPSTALMTPQYTPRTTMNRNTGTVGRGGTGWSSSRSITSVNKVTSSATWREEVLNKAIESGVEIVVNTIIESNEPEDDDPFATRLAKAATTDSSSDVERIFYPVAASDTCDCVTFPDTTDYELTSCSADAYWSTYQLQYSDGSCFDITFYPSDVYAECMVSDLSEVDEYFLCEIDFTDDADEVAAKKETNEPDTTDPDAEDEDDSKKVASLRQESADESKTRIHLSVHRLLTFALEAVLALQAPFVG